MVSEYQVTWDERERARDVADRTRAELEAMRRVEDGRRAEARRTEIERGFTASDVERWAAEDRQLTNGRTAEDGAWALELRRRAEEDRERQRVWAEANPDAAARLEALPSL